MKTHPLTNVIKFLYCQNQIAEYYAYSHDNDHFAVGKVIDFSEEYIIIQAINNKGYQDGFFIGKIKDICRISMHTPYLNAMKSLYDCNYPMKESNTENIFINKNRREGLFNMYIKYVIDEKKIATVTLYGGDSIIGFIDKFRKPLITIKMIDTDGSYHGISYMDVNDIETLSFDGEDENKYAKLIINSPLRNI